LLLNDPAAMFGRFVSPPEVGLLEWAASLRFFAWCVSPAARAAYLRFTRVQNRVMRRGDLFARGVPLPADSNLARPGRLIFKPATLMGFLHPSQYSFRRGSRCLTPACWDFSPRAEKRSSTVHPRMPLSWLSFHPLIFTGVGRRIRTPSERDRQKRPTTK